MSRVERLVVRVEGDTRGLRTAMAEARLTTESASSGMAGAFKGLSGGLKALGAAALGIGTVLAGAATAMREFREAVEFADGIAKTAARLGLTTDALQELQFAAEQSGLEIAEFDGAMQRFVRGLGQAATGEGKVAEELTRLGIAIRDGAGNLRAPEEVLLDLADAYHATTSAAEKLRLSQELFGRGGLVMVNMLSAGAVEMRRLRDEAQRLGLVMDRDLIANAEKLDDQFDIVSRALNVQFKQALLTAAPLVADLTKEIVEALPAIRQYIEEFLNIGKFGALEEMREVTAEIAHLQSTITEMRRASGGGDAFGIGVEDHFGAATNITGGVSERLAEAQEELEAALHRQAELQARLREYEAPATPADGGAAGPGSSGDDEIEELEAEAGARSAVAAAVGEQTVALDEFLQRLQRETELQSLASDQREVERALDEARAQARRDFENGLRSTAELLPEEIELIRQLIEQKQAFIEMERQSAEAIDGTNKRMEEQKTAIEAQADAMADLAERTGRTLEDSAVRLVKNYQDWRDIAVDALTQIVEHLWEVYEAQQAVGNGGGGGGGGGSGGIGGFLGFIGQAIGGLFGSGTSAGGLGTGYGTHTAAAGFAGGGRPPVGEPSIVGERGPELFVPDRPGMVISNDNLRAMMARPVAAAAPGGATVVINNSYDFRGAQDGLMAQVKKMVDQGTRDAVTAVADAADRGGSYASKVGRRQRR